MSALSRAPPVADGKASHGASVGRRAQEAPLGVVSCGQTWLCRYGGCAGQPVAWRCSQF